MNLEDKLELEHLLESQGKSKGIYRSKKSTVFTKQDLRLSHEPKKDTSKAIILKNPDNEKIDKFFEEKAKTIQKLKEEKNKEEFIKLCKRYFLGTEISTRKLEQKILDKLIKKFEGKENKEDNSNKEKIEQLKQERKEKEDDKKEDKNSSYSLLKKDPKKIKEKEESLKLKLDKEKEKEENKANPNNKTFKLKNYNFDKKEKEEEMKKKKTNEEVETEKSKVNEEFENYINPSFRDGILRNFK
jgi:hypothetical protein